jgi:hypothetical protein
MAEEMERHSTWNELKANGIIKFARQYVSFLVKMGRFPKPDSQGTRRIAWKDSQIRAWFDWRAMIKAALEAGVYRTSQEAELSIPRPFIAKGPVRFKEPGQLSAAQAKKALPHRKAH